MKFHPAANLFPLLEGAEFERFADDIEANGLKEPILIHARDGSIIDGRNRFRACEARHLEPKFHTYEGTDDGLLDVVFSANLHRRHLNESQRALVAAKVANMERGDNQHAPIGATSQADAADKLNVARRSVQRAAVVLDTGAQGLIAAVETGGIAVSDAALIADRPIADQDALLATVTGGEKKNLKAAVRAADIAKQRAEIEAGNLTLPDGVFDCIVIDPPWDYGTEDDYEREYMRIAVPYPTCSLEELASLEVPAAKDCILWLWTTHRFMHDAFHLLETWGFQHKVILTWTKDRMGIGRWLRSQSEFCIMAVRGHPKVDLTTETTVLEAPTREHSRKPDQFYELVEGLCVAERRLDYFSREKREGWEQLGNDADKFQ